MKALILNSGIGKRMGEFTINQPKCMVNIGNNQTIVSRQLALLQEMPIDEIIMTTGPQQELLEEYCRLIAPDMNLRFVHNPSFDETNYIFSTFLAEPYLHDDIILMHGDLVFDKIVIEKIVQSKKSCMVVSSTLPIPEKDFKAVVVDGRIDKIGVEYFTSVYAAQPLYKLYKEDWEVWLANIVDYCNQKITNCYAENAFNEVSTNCCICPLDVQGLLCSEIDNADDLAYIMLRLGTNDCK